MSDKRERFGRYLILDHLVDGGMAKICRARFLGEQADKIVAIKMVQPQYSQDENFKKMFMDEIKLTFGLLHPNIVQTYDYGIHNGQLFVAMEYCDGKNLKEYLEKLKEKKFVFPVEISVYIVTQACQGLHYAHNYTDKLTGKKTKIVHRDISPHNLMLTYDGAIKVIDFGIAKAETNSEATQAGTIKGKLSYLAPEYLEGMELDHRYDQFAVGITLWEMLCSRKLFKAPNDLAVLKKIQECRVPPPSSINPNVSKELDQIVLRALSKDRNKRFKDMEELNRALIKFLYSNFPDFNSSDLNYFAKELFKDDLKKDREKMFEFGKIDVRPFLEELKEEVEGGSRPAAQEAPLAYTSDEPKRKSQEQVIDFGFEGEDTKPSQRRSITRKNNAKNQIEKDMADSVDSKGSDGIELGALAPKKVMGATASRARAGGRSKDNSWTESSTVRRVDKPKSKVKAAAVALLILGGGYFGYNHVTEKAPLREPADTTKKVLTVEEKAENEKQKNLKEFMESEKNNRAMVKIRLPNFEKHQMKVYVSGREVEPSILKEFKVPNGKDFYLRVESPGRRPYVQKINVNQDSNKTFEIPEMPFESFGRIVTSRSCLIGKINFNLYGEERSEDLPIKGLGLYFPTTGDGRVPADDSGITYDVFVQKLGETIEKRVKVRFDKNTPKVDLCNLL
ncbi:MAG: hypothetical protein COW00_08980 [Bdellovibrio sp. CG12_big_fil_rev_8_21_14_0_65_39_13]|nr:MAG: hypothetical protein COW00_08980 [Bdellovibrio sp. CG12_big_fil_rev_8_21_14_0_65_39_13]PIR36212.1 MAG: hypothetical protein COV37_04405 [Bdellovibrio sp. CG11_big_fil_rev_8_21_14_0_20_39_38]PJB54384.1 MAG: hypothetical protein CO099_01905 [Bdellovibrio sp. CG_4_9_14_3_um_filter_39_7]